MKLRSGNEIREDEEQTLEAKNKEGYLEPVSLETKQVRMPTLRELAPPNIEPNLCPLLMMH